MLKKDETSYNFDLAIAEDNEFVDQIKKLKKFNYKSVKLNQRLFKMKKDY